MAHTCHACGTVNSDELTVCSSCGVGVAPNDQTTIIPLPTDGDTMEVSLIAADAVVTLPEGSALLVVRKGALEGVRFALEGQVGTSLTLGRSPESDIFLDDVTVSRKHATVTRTNDGWLLTDAGSLNGTYVNRSRVDSVQLANEDEVQIGKYRFTFLNVTRGI